MTKYKGMLPGTFTMGNVVCGFLAILSAFDGNVTTACWLVILAGFLDVLDGKIARLSGTTSQFGVELDSLADFLSFGVAPAVIVHSIQLVNMGKWGWLISVVYIMAASFRLARYNVLADSDEKQDFMGLPVPIAAAALVSYIIFSFELWGGLRHGEILVSIVILNAVLMVSQIEYVAMPDNFNSSRNRIRLVLLIMSGVAIILQPRLLLFPISAAYILFGIVRLLYILFSRSVEKVKGKTPDQH